MTAKAAMVYGGLIVTPENFLNFFDFTINDQGNQRDAVRVDGYKNYWLTEDANNQVASTVLIPRVLMTSDFRLEAEIMLGVRAQQTSGADGIGFVFHPNSTRDLGNYGGANGIGGLSNGIGFKLDTWRNASVDMTRGYTSDPRMAGPAGSWATNTAATGTNGNGLAFGSFVFTDDTPINPVFGIGRGLARVYPRPDGNTAAVFPHNLITTGDLSHPRAIESSTSRITDNHWHRLTIEYFGEDGGPNGEAPFFMRVTFQRQSRPAIARHDPNATHTNVDAPIIWEIGLAERIQQQLNQGITSYGFSMSASTGGSRNPHGFRLVSFEYEALAGNLDVNYFYDASYTGGNANIPISATLPASALPSWIFNPAPQAGLDPQDHLVPPSGHPLHGQGPIPWGGDTFSFTDIGQDTRIYLPTQDLYNHLQAHGLFMSARSVEYVADQETWIPGVQNDIPAGLISPSIIVAAGLYDPDVFRADILAFATGTLSYWFRTVLRPIIVIKTCADSNMPIAGAVFDLYDDQGNFIETITTGSDGRATSSSQRVGRYYLIEVDTPPPFVLATEPIPVEIEWMATQTEPVYVNVTNERAHALIRVYKYGTSLSDGQPWRLVEGFQYRVYRILDEELEEYTINDDNDQDMFDTQEVFAVSGYLLDDDEYSPEANSYPPDEYEHLSDDDEHLDHDEHPYDSSYPLVEKESPVAVSNYEYIETITTTNTGVAISSALDFGRYRVIESFAPHPWALNPTPMYATLTDSADGTHAVANLMQTNDPHTFRITFDHNVFPNVPMDVEHVVEFGLLQHLYTPPTPVDNPGYTFGGWVEVGTDALPNLEELSQGITRNIDFIAAWNRIAPQPRVYFYENHNHSTPTSSLMPWQTANPLYGQSVANPGQPPTREGFTFLHWSTSRISGDEFDFNTTFHRNFIEGHPIYTPYRLFAIWKPLQPRVHFYANHYEDEPITTRTPLSIAEPPYGESIYPGTPPIRESYSFKHWSTSPTNATGAFDFDTEVFRRDYLTTSLPYRLFAIWEVKDDSTPMPTPPTIESTPTTTSPEVELTPTSPTVHSTQTLTPPPTIEPMPTQPLWETDIPFNPLHYAYIIGYPDGLVRPNSNITRAEAITIFFRLIADEYRAEIWAQDNPFYDVQVGNWFNNAVSTMANAGWIVGYDDKTFRPNQSIMRAEFASLVAQFINYVDVRSSRFNDIHAHWAEDAINLLGYIGLADGYVDGTFRPNQPITRAEASALINRLFVRLPETVADLLPDMVTWPDNEDVNTWHYLYVQESTNSHYHMMRADGIHETWTQIIAPRDWTLLERP